MSPAIRRKFWEILLPLSEGLPVQLIYWAYLRMILGPLDLIIIRRPFTNPHHKPTSRLHQTWFWFERWSQTTSVQWVGVISPIGSSHCLRISWSHAVNPRCWLRSHWSSGEDRLHESLSRSNIQSLDPWVWCSNKSDDPRMVGWYSGQNECTTGLGFVILGDVYYILWDMKPVKNNLS